MRTWFLVWLAYLSLFAFGFVDNARGPIFPDLLKQLSLSDSLGAWFFFIPSAAAFLNNFFLLNWIERIGAYRATQIYSVTQAIGLVIIGLGQSYLATLVGSAILGASFGALGISVNILVAEGAPKSFRRQALSGLHCMYGISSLFAPLLVTGLFHAGLGWRESLGVLAVLPLLVLFASFYGGGEALQLKLKARQQGAKVEVGGDRAGAPDLKVALFFASFSTLYVVSEISVSTRLALYARREWGYSAESANVLLAGFFLGLFLGRLVFAIVPIRMNSRRALTISAALSLIFYGLGLIFHPAFLAVTGLTMSVFYPCAIALINELRGLGDARYITSWCITLQSLGVMAMHFLLGGLADAFGLHWALWIGPVALALVCTLLNLKTRFLQAK